MRYILVVLFMSLFSINCYSYTLYWFTGAGIKKPAKKIAEL